MPAMAQKLANAADAFRPDSPKKVSDQKVIRITEIR